MGVTLYLFDEREKLRKPLLDGVSELIHQEAAYTLTARIPAKERARPGEYLGFGCVDGRFRLFAIDKAELDDDKGETILTATDAAVAELADAVTIQARGEGLTAWQAVELAISETEFEIGESVEGETGDINAYYEKTWTLLEEIEQTHNVRIIPYYEFADGMITGKYVDVASRTPVYRGRIIEAAQGASGVSITHTGRPMTAAYATGAATGTEDPPTRVTLADAEWSTAAGDPADKPRGQAYIINPDVSQARMRAMIYKDENESDPQKLLEKTWEALKKSAQPVAGGTASASDIEMLPGMRHQMIRPHDLVAIKAKAGETACAEATGIARNYVREDLTKFTFGGEDAKTKGISKRVASLARSQEKTTNSTVANRQRYIVNAGLIQLNGTLIQLNAEAIQANARTLLVQAEQIDLKADYTQVTELGEITNSLAIEMDAVTGELALKAKQTDLDEVSITLRAAEEEIELRAKIVDVNAEITRVRTLIADEIEAVLSEVALSMADSVVTRTLNVSGSAAVSSLLVGSHTVKAKSMEVITSVKANFVDAFNVMLYPTGASRAIRYVESVTVQAGTINYFGYD